MTELIAIAGKYIFIIGGIVVAALGLWFGGKSKGSTETQAKADVKDAESEKQAANDIVIKSDETIKAVKDVAQTNQSLSDDAARDRMRQSKYNSPD